MRHAFTHGLVLLLLSAVAPPLLAQGEDGTRAQRNMQVLGSLLPGRYDNFNQLYFAKRLQDPLADKLPRQHINISKAEAANEYSIQIKGFESDGETVAAESALTAALSPHEDGRRVLMRFSSILPLEKPSGYCDLIWRREAGQFRAELADPNCSQPDPVLPKQVEIAERDLWWSSSGDTPRLEFERARLFTCYLDVPGVGGGKAIPYKRYELGELHDKSEPRWVTLQDGTELSVRLTNVRWPMNNLKGIFTRHSFVIYLGERQGKVTKEIAYSWTHPDAQRIGLNVKTALVNCFMLNNETIEPFFRDEPRR